MNSVRVTLVKSETVVEVICVLMRLGVGKVQNDMDQMWATGTSIDEASWYELL